MSMFLRLSIPPRDRRAEAAHRRAPRHDHRRADLRRAAAEPRHPGPRRRRPDAHRLRGGAGDARRRRDGDPAPADLLASPTSTTARCTPRRMLSPRVAPQMIGLGLLEAIPEADIRARADPDDKDGDGISGRANEVWSIEREPRRRSAASAGRPACHRSRQQAARRLRRRHRPLEPARRRSPPATAPQAQAFCLNAPNGDTPRRRRGGQHEAVRPRRVLRAEPRRAAAAQSRATPTCCAARRCSRELGCAAATRRRFTTGNGSTASRTSPAR